MLTVLIFVGLAALTFAVVMLLTRPTATDRAAKVRLTAVQTRGRSLVPGGTTPEGFLLNNRLSEIAWFDRVLQRLSGAHKLSLLLGQAESSWSVGTVLIASAVLGLMGFA